VNLTCRTVESDVRLGPNVHSNADGSEILMVEKVALEDEGVKAEIAKLKLPEGTVVVTDPWVYGRLITHILSSDINGLSGSDGVNDGLFTDDKRMFQCFLYVRDPSNSSEVDGNHYAMPIGISPVVSAETMKVTRIDILPTGVDNTIKKSSPYKIQPPNEYIPEANSLRADLKPLNVIQPEGASFTVSNFSEQGHEIFWQKWIFKVGFNQREGMVLYDVRYNGRPLFYRLSLSDLNIPYADPRHPFHKKSAFDFGDVGAGIMANDLRLGCDCLGSIHYLSAILSNDHGDPTVVENCVCIHEQDGGIGWKHTNYRTERAVVVRNRELVLQSIITVSNYEYILAFIFNQAGEVDYEVRATGILSTQPIDEGIDVPWGTVVHPGALAAYHQHIFSLRIDPMIDGPFNSLVYEEAHAMPRSDFNPHGVGYTASTTIISESSGLDLNPDNNRTFKIQNTSVRNPVNGKPVGYKIHTPPFQKLLADRQSYNFRRAEFADHNIYVTAYRDNELYAGGKYTNQSRGGTGVRTWAARKDDVKDKDIVVWVQFGINHLPRTEDFPVMPCEIIRVALKPVNFFEKNPAIDVPPANQAFNKSVLVTVNGEAEAVVRNGGKACCTDTNGVSNDAY
jgi:primary-amine oxidase